MEHVIVIFWQYHVEKRWLIDHRTYTVKGVTECSVLFRCMFCKADDGIYWSRQSAGIICVWAMFETLLRLH